ncbi:MAG TPA: hypothetical protein VK914_05395 [bacterium]|jgi:hypothetical protein|nr:hypothetical protein [bacterium]
MNVSQNVSAIFNSPEIAEMVLQSVQAGELAELQGLASTRRESERREHQVTGAEASEQASTVDPHPSDQPLTMARPPRRPPHARPPLAQQPEETSPEPGGGHRINLLA